MTFLDHPRTIRALVVLGALVHVGIALAVWQILLSSGGLLRESDEVLNVSWGDEIAEALRRGHWPEWSEITLIETNPGFYFWTGFLRLLFPGDVLPLRLANVMFCLAAVFLWTGALHLRREPRETVILFLLAALWLPSPMLWSSLVLKEAAIYCCVAGVAFGLAWILAARDRIPPAALLVYALSLTAFCFLRNYVAVLVLGLTLGPLWFARGWRVAAVCGLTAAACMVISNPYLFAIAKTDLAVAQVSTRIGASAISADTSLLQKVWLFLTFPLPWQASSMFQQLATPEVLLFLLAVPAIVVGLVRKFRARDPFAAFVLLWLVSLSAVYIGVVSNLGTLYRAKSSMLFGYAYFAAAGFPALIDWIRKRLR